jgi:hypothetical protein
VLYFAPQPSPATRAPNAAPPNLKPPPPKDTPRAGPRKEPHLTITALCALDYPRVPPAYCKYAPVSLEIFRLRVYYFRSSTGRFPDSGRKLWPPPRRSFDERVEIPLGRGEGGGAMTTQLQLSLLRVIHLDQPKNIPAHHSAGCSA